MLECDEQYEVAVHDQVYIHLHLCTCTINSNCVKVDFLL